MVFQKLEQLGASNLLSLKLMMSRLPGENKIKTFYFFELLPIANLDIENLISQKPLQLGASNLLSLLKIISR